jgi:hypothetical protein
MECDGHKMLLDKVVTLASIAGSIETSIKEPLQFIPQAVKNIF